MSLAKTLVPFVLAVIFAFVAIGNSIPQIKSGPVELVVEIGETPDELVAAGKRIFMSDRAQCLTCHSLGEDPKARCPNQEGLGERASSRKPGLSAAHYLIESVYNPNAFIVPGYPKNQMTPINKPPIALSHDEILAVVTYLNTLGGTTDEAFVGQVRAAQDPWRKGLLKPDVASEEEKLPIFPGNSAHGPDVMEKMGCRNCHRVGSEGGEVGPDLTAIGASQSAEYIMESIIDPYAVIVKGFKQLNVLWKDEDRDDLTGVPLEWIPDREAPLEVRVGINDDEGNQVEQTVNLAEVASIGDTVVAAEIDGEFVRYGGDYIEGDEQSGVLLSVLEEGRWIEKRIDGEVIEFVNFPMSPMPSNFAEMMTPRDVYDLLAYLLEEKETD